VDLERLAGGAGRLLVTLLGVSWRFDYRRPRGGRAGRVRGRPVLFSFWHGRQFPLIFTHRREGVTVLVSIHRDGEYVARVLESMGFRTVRGSTTRGGGEALRRLAAVLGSGNDAAITPDGPRGPAGRAKRGMGYLSRLAGRSVVPMGASAWPSIRFRSWDRFVVPLPFARLVVVEGRPSKAGSGSDADSAVSLFEAELDRVTSLADYLALPVSRAFSGCASTAGAVLAPLASAILLTRPRLERSERRGIVARRTDSPVVLHGSSMGEVSGLLPLAEHLRSHGVPVHMTCSTPTARSLLEASGFPSSFVALDCPSWVGRFLESVSPSALVLSEAEIWPNLIGTALERSVPCISVNARLSERSLRRFVALTGPSAGRLLSCFCAILARTAEDAARLERLGVRDSLIRVVGDSKALADAGEPPCEWRERLPAGGRFMVAGSTREGEELPVCLAAIEAGLHPVIAPRHLERVASVAAALRRAGVEVTLWSTGVAAEPGRSCTLVDSMGFLARLYGLAEVAFVGGTLAPLGGHNILEPLKRGVPVVVGESTASIRRTVEMGVAAGAVTVSPQDLLASAFASAAERRPDPAVLRELGRAEGRTVLGAFTDALRRAGAWPAGLAP